MTEQERTYARIEVIALLVDDDVLSALLEELSDAVGDGGLAVGACYGDYRAVDPEHLTAFSACEMPEDDSGEVAGVAPKQV